MRSQGCGDPRITRSGLSGCRTLPRLSADRGLRQFASAASCDDAPRSPYDDSALPHAIDDYDRRRDALHAIPRSNSGPTPSLRGDLLRLVGRQARQPPRPEGAAVPPYRFTRIQLRLKGPRNPTPTSALPALTCHHPTEEDHHDNVIRSLAPIFCPAPDTRLAASAIRHADADRECTGRRSRRDQEARSDRRDGRRFGRSNSSGWQADGLRYELIEDLRKYAPFEIKQEILPWTGSSGRLQYGKYDVAITAAIITKERKQSLEFTRRSRTQRTTMST